MMKKFLLGGLAALTLIPTTAMAQPYHAQDRQDVREARRDVNDARRDVRDAKRDLRDARWDYRREVRDYNRERPWRAAPFKYQSFKAGVTIRPVYYGRNYVVNDWRRFHWDAPRANQVWVRHYDDALLVNTRTGRVVKVIHNAFRYR
ncbi:Ni/Co efflux regulator RcnB [Sphingobium sp. B11D3B]|uniref:RcnB family protein n=1 Tax=Sphingobium sp. B11D3B TaxID=2940575 RepID=UPI002227C405|nr:RcnB family protein [Sphingobium sp. B11D3B]MCW2387432.1 Ni/Co efflux regulator RcnB [Sphingobium sp. B11D3B]